MAYLYKSLHCILYHKLHIWPSRENWSLWGPEVASSLDIINISPPPHTHRQTDTYTKIDTPSCRKTTRWDGKAWVLISFYLHRCRVTGEPRGPFKAKVYKGREHRTLHIGMRGNRVWVSGVLNIHASMCVSTRVHAWHVSVRISPPFLHYAHICSKGKS